MAIKRKTVAQPAHNARGVSMQRQFSSFCLRLHGQPGIAPLQQFVAGALARLLRAQRLLLVLDTPDGPQVVASQLPAGEVDAALLPAITPWLDEARRKRSVRLRHGPVAAAAVDQRSCMVAPLVASKKLLGFLYADIEGALGRFDDTDRDLLGMLAAQAAVALDNSQWAYGLEASLAARIAELGDSLARQTATAEVLRILGSSMSTRSRYSTPLCAAARPCSRARPWHSQCRERE